MGCANVTPTDKENRKNKETTEFYKSFSNLAKGEPSCKGMMRDFLRLSLGFFNSLLQFLQDAAKGCFTTLWDAAIDILPSLGVCLVTWVSIWGLFGYLNAEPTPQTTTTTTTTTYMSITSFLHGALGTGALSLASLGLALGYLRFGGFGYWGFLTDWTRKFFTGTRFTDCTIEGNEGAPPKGGTYPRKSIRTSMQQYLSYGGCSAERLDVPEEASSADRVGHGFPPTGSNGCDDTQPRDDGPAPMPPHTTTFTGTTPATGAPPKGWMYLWGRGFKVMESRVYHIFAVSTQINCCVFFKILYFAILTFTRRFKTSLLVQAKRMSTRLKMIYTRCHFAFVGALFCSLCIYGLGASILRGTTALFWLCVAMVSHILFDAASLSTQLLTSIACIVVEKGPEFLVFGHWFITNATRTINSATAYSFEIVCSVADHINSETVGLMMGVFFILAFAGLSCYTAPNVRTIMREDQIGFSSTRTRNRQIVR